MELRVFADEAAVATKAATLIAGEARAAVAARGRFIMAVSGGHTPWQMLRALAGEDVPWKSVYVAQVDERVASAGGRGRFIMAVSGGHTPWQMLRALAGEDVPWKSVYVAQVDERVASAGDPDRNLTHLRDSLLAHAPLPPENVCAMAVDSPDLAVATRQYAIELQ